jgi:hypothetical protein
MDNLEYVRLVDQHKSIKYNGENVNIERFIKSIELLITDFRFIDYYKTKMFSESNKKEFANEFSFSNCSQLPYQFKNYDEGVELINSILNIASESRYLLEILLFIFKNKNIVPISDFKRSTSEIFQHMAVISKFCEISFEEMQIANIEKLRKNNDCCKKYKVNGIEIEFIK